MTAANSKSKDLNGRFYKAILSKDVGSWHPSSFILRLLVSLAIALAVCLFLLVCIVQTNSDDDYCISMFLSTQLQNTGGLCLFVNAFLCRVIFTLNQFAPSINWFFVIEYFSAFLAFWALAFAVLTFVPLGAGLAAMGFVTFFVLPFCISSSNYTVVAGLCTSVGLLYLIANIFRNNASLASGFIGSALLLLGLAWRFQMFAASLPFLGIAIIYWLLRLRRSESRSMDVLKMAIPIVVSLFLCAGLFVYDRLAWTEKGWAEWLEYNEPRTVLSDYPMPAYEEVENELTAMGVSENDYAMLLWWASGDTDMLPTATLQKVATLRQPMYEGPIDVLRTFKRYILDLMGRWIYTVPFLLILLLIGVCNIRTLPFAMIAFCMSLVMCTYFLLIGRLPDRVETPIWLYAIMSSLAVGAMENRKFVVSDRMRMAFGFAGIAMGACVILFYSYKCVEMYLPSLNTKQAVLLFHQEDFEPEGSLSNYVSSHADTYFLMDAEQYGVFGLEYDKLYIPDQSVLMRVMPLGGWDTNAPFRLNQAALLGKTNVVATLLADQPSLLVAREPIAQQVLVFLQEHYDPSISCQLVEPVTEDGQVCAWSYKKALSSAS